jgi:hypothetical protein
MRRYWDGHAWVDVDQVVSDDTRPPPRAAAPRAPRIVSQRGPVSEPAQDRDDASSTGDPEALPD